ncbi:uncharacterized protein LOC132637589 [Lycium barbarum]|uniref:uncharacterized protein LOC132637589 n=1 Tax=Lycium barbarum TaxID=112863 RepID=UPI00293F6E0A|nr:uncharacterized protein LOC132637589 [Lycium barbarum]
MKSQAEESGDEFKEEEVAMISRHVIEAMRRSRNNRKGNSNFRKGKSSAVQRNDGKCYECGKYGHIASECPDAKRKPSKNCQKQRAFSSWGEDKVSKDDEEDMENICFMAIGETSEVRPYHCSNCSETQELLDQTLEDLNRVFNEYKKLKRERRDWELKLEVVETEKDLHQEEVDDLKLQLNGLRKSTSHSSVKSNKSTHNNKSTGKRPINSRNTFDNSKVVSTNYEEINQSNKKKQAINIFSVGFVIHLLQVGYGNPRLIIKALTLKDPRKLGYLKESNYLVLQEHHKKKSKGKWYLDSTCSSHMTGDKSLFKSVADFDGGLVTFGDNSTGTVIVTGTISFNNSCDISNVYLVEGLKYNLLSISQLCDSNLEVRFKKTGCVIEDKTGKEILPGSRTRNVYVLDSVKSPAGHICLTSMGEDP